MITCTLIIIFCLLKKFLRTGKNTYDWCKCCLGTIEDLRLVRMFLGWAALLSVWLLIFKFDILPPTLKFNLLPPQPCWLAGPTACWPENSRPHTFVGRKNRPCGLLARINRPHSLVDKKLDLTQLARQEVRSHTAC
jgi:hypothetical protein